jgi:hypothetical protein
MSVVVRIADSNQTSRQVRKVPNPEVAILDRSGGQLAPAPRFVGRSQALIFGEFYSNRDRRASTLFRSPIALRLLRQVATLCGIRLGGKMTGVLDHYLVDPEISLCRLRSSGDAAWESQATATEPPADPATLSRPSSGRRLSPGSATRRGA